MTTKETPTYEIVNIGYDDDGIFSADICGESAELLCRVFGDNPQGEAKAKFIVRACNSHDALVEALEGGIRYLEKMAADQNSPADQLIADEFKRAIALAKGE